MHLQVGSAQEVLRAPRPEHVGHLRRRQVLLVRQRLVRGAVDRGRVGRQLEVQRLRQSTSC